MLLKSRMPVNVEPENLQRDATFGECVDRLSDCDALVRAQAARELAWYDDGASVLLERLTDEPTQIVREAIFTSLAVQANASAVEGLVDLLGSEDAGLRNGAIETLKLFPEDVALHIPELLSNRDPDVRILTISILESLRHPSVEDWLISVIEQDEHVNVCGSALDLLAEIGTEKSVGPVNALRERFANSSYIQFAADLALNRVLNGQLV